MKVDKFFLKCELGAGRGDQIDPHPQEKLPSKIPTLLGLILLKILNIMNFDKRSVSLGDKSVAGSGVTKLTNKSAANNEIKQNLQLTEELHKPIIRDLKKRTVYLEFKGNIRDVHLADMQLTSKFNKGLRFLLWVIGKKWFKDNDIEMYSIHNEGKSDVPERFIRTLKTKISKYMPSISKKAYINKLDDIVNNDNR